MANACFTVNFQDHLFTIKLTDWQKILLCLSSNFSNVRTSLIKFNAWLEYVLFSGVYIDYIKLVGMILLRIHAESNL